MSFLQQALIFLGAAVIAVPIATRLGLGAVLGYLAAGILVGPHGLRLSGDPGAVLHVAELGVVLLLFLIGLELDPKRLATLGRAVFAVGGAQVVGTAAALGALAIAVGIPWRGALVAALALSLSSTALGVQLLGERRELQTAHGRAAFGVLLLQDLAAIPMLALVPALGGGARTGLPGTAVLHAAVVIAVVIGAGRLVARPALQWVASLRNPELFTATALLLVVGTAALVASTGLSMALGAFLAGVLLANTEYRHELEADLAPFKGLLLGLFFLGIGMTADLSLLRHRPGMVLALVLALVATKAAVAYAIGRLLNGGDRDGALSFAVVLSQGGEFAFVLFGVGARHGLLAPEAASALVLAVALSMATTPALLALHVRFVRPRLAPRDRRAFDVAPDGEPPVIIAGFGRVGQVVGRLLRARRIPFTALDASPEHIDFIRKFGNKVFYGDASRIDLLRAARADAARIFVLAIDDVEASVRTAELVLEQFPHLVILARARNRQHAYRLRKLGITRITRETFQSSIDLSAGVLEALGVAHEDAVAAGARLREQDEAMFEESWRYEGDLAKLTDIAHRGREELERLFDQDAEQRRAG